MGTGHIGLQSYGTRQLTFSSLAFVIPSTHSFVLVQVPSIVCGASRPSNLWYARFSFVAKSFRDCIFAVRFSAVLPWTFQRQRAPLPCTVSIACILPRQFLSGLHLVFVALITGQRLVLTNTISS